MILAVREVRMCHPPGESGLGIPFGFLLLAFLLCQRAGFGLAVLQHQVAVGRVGHVAEPGTCARPSGLQVQLALQPVFVRIQVLLHEVVQDFLVLGSESSIVRLLMHWYANNDDRFIIPEP